MLPCLIRYKTDSVVEVAEILLSDGGFGFMHIKKMFNLMEIQFWSRRMIKTVTTEVLTKLELLVSQTDLAINETVIFRNSVSRILLSEVWNYRKFWTQLQITSIFVTVVSCHTALIFPKENCACMVVRLNVRNIFVVTCHCSWNFTAAVYRNMRCNWSSPRIARLQNGNSNTVQVISQPHVLGLFIVCFVETVWPSRSFWMQ